MECAHTMLDTISMVEQQHWLVDDASFEMHSHITTNHSQQHKWSFLASGMVLIPVTPPPPPLTHLLHLWRGAEGGNLAIHNPFWKHSGPFPKHIQNVIWITFGHTWETRHIDGFPSYNVSPLQWNQSPWCTRSYKVQLAWNGWHAQHLMYWDLSYDQAMETRAHGY